MDTWAAMQIPAALLSLLLALMCTACTVASGNGWKYSSVGGDAKNISAEGIQSVNNSKAFGKGADTINGLGGKYILGEGLKYLGGKYYDAKGAEVSSAQAIDLEKLRNAKSVNDATAAQKALETNLAAEAEAAVAPTAVSAIPGLSTGLNPQ